MEVVQFHPPFSSQAEQEGLLTLCPVRALHTYVHFTQPLRKSHSQLFIFLWKGQTKVVSKQHVSRWLVDVISYAYTERGLPVPLGIQAH